MSTKPPKGPRCIPDPGESYGVILAGSGGRLPDELPEDDELLAGLEAVVVVVVVVVAGAAVLAAGVVVVVVVAGGCTGTSCGIVVVVAGIAGVSCVGAPGTVDVAAGADRS